MELKSASDDIGFISYLDFVAGLPLHHCDCGLGCCSTMGAVGGFVPRMRYTLYRSLFLMVRFQAIKAGL